MAGKVVLDAMIRRADFAHQAESLAIELGSTLKLNEITGNSPAAKFLRKPDFQRETNHWAPNQVANLIQSFVSGELIPALILWKSESFVFVIDGAHRLSALKAWVENDYGDGHHSSAFYSGNIPSDQRRIAERSRRLVERTIGRYSDFVAMTEQQLESEPEKAKLHSVIFSRSLHVQWVQGNQDVAESSFFKINSQGTSLDSTEELLLKNRRKSYAIASRSIVRAGSGHKYWSRFDGKIREEIESCASKCFEILFEPDVEEPIKTLDLPVGGTVSPVDALKMLIDVFGHIDGEADAKKKIASLKDDQLGQETLNTLKAALKLANRISGNSPGSLGLHPAVYFYTERGKHSRFLFLGIIRVIADAIRNNDAKWFKRFTKVRAQVEHILLTRKSLINQGLANVNSSQRVERVSNLFRFLIRSLESQEEIDDQKILAALGLKGQAGDLKIIDAPKGFSTDVKSAAYLQTALETAPKCCVCGGYLYVLKSVSYDHVLPKSKGGSGGVENIQLLHPFCNTGVKGADTNPG